MALSEELIKHLESKLPDGKIVHHLPVSGGSINQVYCLMTGQSKYLLKMNNTSAFPGMFACEAEGLQAIADTHTIGTPKVIGHGDVDDDSYLILEWIDTRRPDPEGSKLLGAQLAKLHQVTANEFGFHTDNYMGSLKQKNHTHNTWSSFFIEQRLMPMVKIAVDKHLLTEADHQNFEKLYQVISGLFDEEEPSLLHGDLWSGNYLISAAGMPYLIDPAVSYGHREFDIAMTTLFGGFNAEFYQSYNETFPLANGWEQRLDMWNVYPLLLHLNLFGKSYLGQVRDNLKGYL